MEAPKTQEELDSYNKAVELDRLVQFNALLALLMKKKIITEKEFKAEIAREHKVFANYLKKNNEQIQNMVKGINNSKASYIG